MAKPRKSRPVREVDRHDVRAVAIDANVFGDGLFTIKRLQALLKDAQEADVELWLPEVVAWELATAIAERLDAVRETTKGADGALRRAGLDGIQLPYPDRVTVIQEVLKVLEKQGVKMIEITSEDALAALRDQVQLSGPGRRKEGVKTGGADSAWVRSVLRQADKTPSEEIVLVSADGEVDKMLADAAKPNVSLAASWNEVRHHLFQYEVSTEAADDVVRLLVEAIQDGSFSEILELEPLADGGIVGEIDAGWWHYQEPFSVEFDLEVVRWLAALRDVEANARGGVRATAVFLADVTVAGWFNDNDGNPVIDEEKFFDATVKASILIRLEGGRVTLATIEDAAQARAPALRWWDEDEALGEMLNQLDYVPALKKTGMGFSIVGQPGEVSEFEVPLGKEKLSLSISKDPGAGWELTATIGDEQLTVRCEHDVTAWVGGEKEGMYMEPPYVLSIEPGDLVYGNPFYALNAFAMHRSAAG